MRAFLWSGSADKRRAKVSWPRVCAPKDEGGLGLRRAVDCNKGSMMRMVWDILTDRSSLWVRWCKAEILKGCTLWRLEPKQSHSVTWKNILSLRAQVAANLVYSVGINSSWSLWHDPWFQNFPLFSRLGSKVIYDSGLSRDATVSEVILDSAWNWPDNVEQLREISIPCADIPIGQHDSISWHSKGRPFSFKSAWESIRASHSGVPWAKIVWFKGAIPSHAFCLWLSFHKAHLTKDKLQNIGLIQCSLCSFGCGQQESMNHLFFECPFTKSVWSKVLEFNICPFPTACSWDSTASWALGRTKGRQFHRWMRRVGLAATVYHCWRERNSRIFRHVATSPSQVVDRIAFDVAKKAALCWNIPDTPTNRDVVENWGIDESIFITGRLLFGSRGYGFCS
ncbi:zf-RVT domain-containing protein [Cephalotus follicularis]|uniref:Zf-RVT domain-containing protein n=1 Tax=Cephalotus follicularis TaxID=3775 RepID=A0A1Q3BD90_CEPFO|nr:zf-RVT domain-containing protein [Cephalotus follicularis]